MTRVLLHGGGHRDGELCPRAGLALIYAVFGDTRYWRRVHWRLDSGERGVCEDRNCESVLSWEHHMIRHHYHPLTGEYMGVYWR